MEIYFTGIVCDRWLYSNDFDYNYYSFVYNTHACVDLPKKAKN
ncbi:hypothetical protein [Scytonema hofmannii]|nr:hypothetical protein [Scytonema hofmannii]